MGIVNSGNKPIDVIVVGAGITGSLLTYLLTEKNARVYLLDKGQESSSSAVAAGIINPITGKNYIKSWNIDIFLPKAKEVYTRFEKEFGQKIIYEYNILRRLPNPGAENIWEGRKIDGRYENYIEKDPGKSVWKDNFQITGAYAEVTGSMRVDIRKFMETIKHQQEAHGLFRNENFIYEDLSQNGERWTYKDLQADYIIFCEGARGVNNPFFTNQPFALSKGYALEVYTPDHGIELLFKDEIFLAPLGADTMWAGGAYSNVLDDQNRDEQEFDKIFTKLSSWYKKPFQVKLKSTAIRPTTKNRRPILLENPLFHGMYFLNGMGTKGTSMAPFYTEVVADFLCTKAKGENLDVPIFDP